VPSNKFINTFIAAYKIPLVEQDGGRWLHDSDKGFRLEIQVFNYRVVRIVLTKTKNIADIRKNFD
jgi:hypothetical protein